MKNPITHLMITVLMCALSLVGYGVWYAVLSAKSAAVADLDSAIAAKTETLNRIAVTRTALSGVAEDEAIAQSYFVPETGVVAFIDALEMQGKERGAGVSVLSVATGGTTDRPHLALSLSIKGTFEAVMRSVGAIEYLPYVITIEGVSITQEDRDVWSADLTVTVGSLPAPSPTAENGASTQTASPTAIIYSTNTHAFF